MKVAVASDDGKTIAAHTGRCRSFIIYEVSDGKAVRVEDLDNRFTPHMQQGAQGGGQGEAHPQHLHDGEGPHGSGCGSGRHGSSEHSGGGQGGGGHAVLLDALKGVEILIARGMGPRLVNELIANGIHPVFSAVEDADLAVRQFAEGNLEELTGGGMCDH